MKQRKIATFYNDKLSYHGNINDESSSPLKPVLLMGFIEKKGLLKYLEFFPEFAPFNKEEFYLAHTKEYVDGFFSGNPPHSTGYDVLGIQWSEDYAESVRFTNSSLYHAIKYSIEHPDTTAFSPTAGFHHATPETGMLFCAFSGQVITSVKLFREKGVAGAYIDLDGHFGNSIEDSREFVPDLDFAVPKGMNINIISEHNEYLETFKRSLEGLAKKIEEEKIHYVVFCHGGDSHEFDDIGHQLTTEEWIGCSTIFYNWVANIERERNKPLPVTLCLFGGYRSDDYDSVLTLHTADLVQCLNRLCGHSITFRPEIKNPQRSG